MNTIEQMQKHLAALEPESMEIDDESAHHTGHAGAKGGGGHYQLIIVSQQFAGKPTIARHRMVYDALRDMMHEQIHALSIKPFAPDEI